MAGSPLGPPTFESFESAAEEGRASFGSAAGEVLSLSSLPPVDSSATPTTPTAKTMTAVRAVVRRRFMSDWTIAAGALVPSLREEGLDELVGVELDEVVGRLAEADQLDRNGQVRLDRQGDAALGRAVQLGQDNAGDPDRVGELPGLDQSVLAGGRVDHEQYLGDPARVPLGNAADLLELLHEVDLGVEAAGSVGQAKVDVAGAMPYHRVEQDRAGMA